MWQHKLSHLIGKISDSDSCIGKIEVKMDSSIGDVSLAINQITEGWYQCIKYMLGYDWYCPSLTRQDIINCLTYHLGLYGPYFDEFDY